MMTVCFFTVSHKGSISFLISCSVVPLVGGWLFSFKSSGQVGPMTERLENWDFTVPF